MAWHEVGANPFLELMLTSHRKNTKEQSYVKQLSNFTHFIEENKNEIVTFLPASICDLVTRLVFETSSV